MVPDTAFPVNGFTIRIDNASQQFFTDRYFSHTAETADTGITFDVFKFTEDHAADPVRLYVHDHPVHLFVGIHEFDQFAVHDVGKTVQPADTVRDRKHTAELEHIHIDLDLVDGFPHLFKHGFEVGFFQRHVVQGFLQHVETVFHGIVVNRVTDPQPETADQPFFIVHNAEG